MADCGKSEEKERKSEGYYLLLVGTFWWVSSVLTLVLIGTIGIFVNATKTSVGTTVVVVQSCLCRLVHPTSVDYRRTVL